MGNVSDKGCRENEYTFYVQELFFENIAAYETMWEKIVHPGRPQMAI